MSKRRRRRRPATWSSVRRCTDRGDDLEQWLGRAIDRGIDASNPLELLMLMSTWLHMAVGDGTGCRDTGYLAPSVLTEILTSSETRNTSAQLGVCSVLLPTATARTHAAAEFAARGTELPAWLRELHTARLVEGLRVPPDEVGEELWMIELALADSALTAIAVFEDDGRSLARVMFGSGPIDDVLREIGCCLYCTDVSDEDPADLALALADRVRKRVAGIARFDFDGSALHPLIVEWFARAGKSV